MPFVVGGAAVTAGGLLAIALGSSTSYLVLALAAAVVYTGLNAVTTAHRALVPDVFDPEGRARDEHAGAFDARRWGRRPRGRRPADRRRLLGAVRATAVLVPLLVLPTMRRVVEPP